MKTIETTLGNKIIHGVDEDSIRRELQLIIQNQRFILISALLQGDLRVYMDYVFHKKITDVQAKRLSSRLLDLREDTLNLAYYMHVVDFVLEKDVFQLDNIEIYDEINLVIHRCLNEEKHLFVEQIY